MTSKAKIISNGTVTGTKVYLDDVDISHQVAKVTWSIDASGPERGPHVTLTLVPRELVIEVEGEIDGH